MSQPIPKKRTKKALGDLLAELSNPAPDSFDPETHGDDGLGRGNGDSDSDDNDFGYVRDETEGREHYLSVGAGKLRRSLGLDLAELGDRYVGERVSRKGLGLEQDDEEEEDDEDEEDAEEDGDEDEEEGEEGDDDDNEDQDEDDSDEEEEEEDEDGMEYDQEKSDQIAADLKKMAEKEKELLRNVASNTNADAEKGAHVKNQLSIWESLLDLRIQMQTPLANANRFPVGEESYGAFTVASEILPKSTVASTTQAISNASTALESFIQELLVTRAQLVVKNETVSLSPPDFATKLIKKRKRQQQQEVEAPEDVTQHLESLWTDINAFETAFEPFRDATIEKWSNKVMASTVASFGSDKKFKAINQSVLSQIRGILSDKERLVKRTRLVRGAGGEASRRLGAVSRGAQDQNEAASAAAADADADAPKTEREEIEAHEERESLKRRAGRGLDSHLSNFDDEVFDDGDFYQQLLKELIEGRLLETDDPLLLSMKWAELKQLQNKTKKKKVVDTKASKGRKIRFTVHEKLQNFMAPEPRGTWHEAMIDELFGSLFGAKMAVADESADAAPSGSADAWGDVQVASDGLKLFG